MRKFLLLALLLLSPVVMAETPEEKGLAIVWRQIREIKAGKIAMLR